MAKKVRSIADRKADLERKLEVLKVKEERQRAGRQTPRPKKRKVSPTAQESLRNFRRRSRAARKGWRRRKAREKKAKEVKKVKEILYFSFTSSKSRPFKGFIVLGPNNTIIRIEWNGKLYDDPSDIEKLERILILTGADPRE